jgi:hypothetical protein
MLTLPNTLTQRLGHCRKQVSYYSYYQEAPLPNADSSTLNESKKRPMVEKGGAYRYLFAAVVARAEAVIE